MWIYMNDSFISVVQDEGEPANLLVRGRRAGDIEAAVGPHLDEGELVVQHTPENDYHFRVSLDRRIVAAALATRLLAVAYPNFKGSVEDVSRHRVYQRVWLDTLQGLDDEPGAREHEWEEVAFMRGSEHICRLCGEVTEDPGQAGECPGDPWGSV